MSEPELFAREAERAIAAALFSESSSRVYEQLALSLRADDFYFVAYRTVFKAVEDLITNGKVPDRTLILTHIKSSGSIAKEIKDDIASAASDTVAIDNIAEYADAVIEKAKARQLNEKLRDIQSKTQMIGGTTTSSEVMKDLDAVALSMDRRASDNKLLSEPKDALSKAVALMESIGTGENFGVRTGLDDLDEKICGMLPGDLVIVAGRPSMGKTAFVLTLTLNHGIRLAQDYLNSQEPKQELTSENAPLVALFSLEMQTDRLAIRMMSNLGSIAHDAIRKGSMSDAEWSRMTQAMMRFSNSDIRIDDDSTLSPALLRAKARMLERRTGKKISLIIIDYLQLMEADVSNPTNRAQEISDISRNLKKIGKEFGCPVVALSQLNRKVEDRANKRPVLSDLRESGAIEQDADTILLLYRDEYYNPDSQDKGVVEINVGKGRDVGTGVVRAEFQGQYQNFRNYTSIGSYESKYQS